VARGRQLLASTGELTALLGQATALVGYPVALVGETVALVGETVALVGETVALVGHSLPPVRQRFARIGYAFPLVGAFLTAFNMLFPVIEEIEIERLYGTLIHGRSRPAGADPLLRSRCSQPRGSMTGQASLRTRRRRGRAGDRRMASLDG
jgi:hypothetical protein